MPLLDDLGTQTRVWQGQAATLRTQAAALRLETGEGLDQARAKASTFQAVATAAIQFRASQAATTDNLFAQAKAAGGKLGAAMEQAVRLSESATADAAQWPAGSPERAAALAQARQAQDTGREAKQAYDALDYAARALLAALKEERAAGQALIATGDHLAGYFSGALANQPERKMIDDAIAALLAAFGAALGTLLPWLLAGAAALVFFARRRR